MVIIKILGTGCPKCRKLKARVADLIEKNKLDAVVEEVTDIDEMLKYGYMMTPGLVINEKLRSFGTVPDAAAILKWLMEAE